MIRFLQTPGPVKKVILGGLLTVICVFMVITLVPGFGADFFGTGSPTRGVVATVAGSNITTLEVQRQARQMLQQQMPRGGPNVEMLLPYFTSQAAEQLISRTAIVEEAKRLGFRATDDDLRDELQHGNYAAVFFPEGKFVGQAAYEERLQQANLTVAQFEQSVKDDILVEKLHNLITGSVLVSDNEIHDQFLKQNTKVKFDYAVLQKEDILKSIHPAEAELKAYYGQHKTSYANSIPEERKVRYAILETSKIEAEIKVSPQEIENYYDQHRDEYLVPEQVNIRQVLIKTPLPGPDGKVDPAGIEAARKKGEAALQELKSGVKFEDVAKKYSDDPSGKTGGSVGWVRRGGFPVADVEKAAFSLAKGANSGLINAGYAFVILHVDDKQDAHAKTLDDVREQIVQTLKAQKASQEVDTQASAFLAQARSGGLDKAAAAKNLQVVTTDFVKRSDSLPGIGNAPQFMEALFSAAEKSPPDEFAVPQGFVVYQLMAIKPAATPTFDEIRSKVESEFKESRATALLGQKTQELSDRAKSEHDLKKAAKEVGATVKTSDLVLPDGQVPDIGSMSGPASVAFTLKVGEISGPINTNTSGAVLQVLERQPPTDEEYAAKRDQIRDSILQQKQQEMFALFVTNLRQEMQKSGKIKINEQEMKSLTRQNSQDEGE